MKKLGANVEVAYLTVEEVFYIHEQVIEAFGGSHGVRAMNLLESAVHRPSASFAGEDLYPNLWLKAAALLHALLFNHAFIDGNKRVAFVAADAFLRKNGYRLRCNQNTAYAFLIAAIESKVDIDLQARNCILYSF
jgi:death-on-curing protein